MENKNVDVSAILAILKKIPLFKDLDENSHREIIQKIVLMYYPANYMLFKEGDEGDALYIVKKGMVEIFHSAPEGELPKTVAQINADGFFGEMALVSDEHRNASAKTLADSEIFILSKDDFKKLLATNTTLAEQISATMVSRINENTKPN
ncbi:MAG: cyclic nucleotide-binding domain-containing protein [Candidatus Peregrinibacteria bacterium]